MSGIALDDAASLEVHGPQRDGDVEVAVLHSVPRNAHGTFYQVRMESSCPLRLLASQGLHRARSPIPYMRVRPVEGLTLSACAGAQALRPAICCRFFSGISGSFDWRGKLPPAPSLARPAHNSHATCMASRAQQFLIRALPRVPTHNFEYNESMAMGQRQTKHGAGE